jgi:hypothetical protein
MRASHFLQGSTARATVAVRVEFYVEEDLLAIGEFSC